VSHQARECKHEGCELCRFAQLAWKLQEYAIAQLADDPHRYLLADGRERMRRELERACVDEKEGLALSAIRHVMQFFEDPRLAGELRELVRGERRARRVRGA
jgi:hypothetical protein